MALSKRQQHVIGALLITIGCGIWFWIYYETAWLSAASWNDYDYERNRALEVLVDTIKKYREQTGEWPANLLELRSVFPDIGLPDLEGPRRVEYVRPREGKGGIVLRSYGHKDTVLGWNLRYDQVVFEMDLEGNLRVVPAK